MNNPFSTLKIETLRKYPVVPILNRECTQAYKVPGSSFTMEKGTAVIIPVLGLQRDPKYYPQPDEFIPERFSPENSKSFEEMPYMPFGDGRMTLLYFRKHKTIFSIRIVGPRVCIGLRLGKLQTKVGLILMLQNYNYHLAENTLQQLKMSAKTLLLAAEGGINLKITKRVVSS